MTKIGVLPSGAQELATEIMLLKHKAGTMGLWETMHALEPATQKIGYEMADILAGKRADHLVEVSPEEQCLWTEDPRTTNWLTACGKKISLFEDDPAEAGMRFCMYCGKLILAEGANNVPK